MSWFLNKTNDELKAMDRIGLSYYYMNKINEAMFFH